MAGQQKQPLTPEFARDILLESTRITGAKQMIEVSEPVLGADGQPQRNDQGAPLMRSTHRLETEGEWEVRRYSTMTKLMQDLEPNSRAMQDLAKYHNASIFTATVLGVFLDDATKRVYVVTEAESSNFDKIQGMRSHWRLDSDPRARELGNKAHSLIGHFCLVRRHEEMRGTKKFSDLLDLTSIRVPAPDFNFQEASRKAKQRFEEDKAMAARRKQ